MAKAGWYVLEYEHHHSIDDDLCSDCRDCCGDADWDDLCDDCRDCGCKGRERQAQEAEDDYRIDPPLTFTVSKPITQYTKKEESNMNRTIAKLFEKTVDAVLVNKFYGHLIQDNDVSYVLLNGKQKELLAAATAKQAEQDKNANVVNARICE